MIGKFIGLGFQYHMVGHQQLPVLYFATLTMVSWSRKVVRTKGLESLFWYKQRPSTFTLRYPFT